MDKHQNPQFTARLLISMASTEATMHFVACAIQQYGLKIRMGKSLDAYGEACDLGNQYGCSMYAELKRKKEGMFFYSGRFFGFNLFFEVG